MNSQKKSDMLSEKHGGKMMQYLPFIIAMLSSTVVYMDKGLLQLAIIPIRTQFNLGAAQAGLLMSAYSLGYALIGLPGGWLIDRFGYRKIILTCLGIATITAFSFAFTSVLFLFIAIRFIMGAAHASLPSATTKIIALNYDEKKKMFLQSFSFLSSNLGTFLATSIGAYLIAINWEYSYICVGVVYIITILLVLRFLPEKGALRTGDKKVNVNSVSLKHIFSDSNIWILAVGVFCFNLFLNGYNMWLASFLSATRHMSMGQIGGILSISNVVGLGSAPLAGVFLSKLFIHREKYFILISTVLAGVCTYLVVTIQNPILITIAILINAYFAVFPFIAVKTIPHAIIDKTIIGSTMGTITAISSFGGFIAPTLLGLIFDVTKSNYQFGYFVLIGIIVFGGIFCLLLNTKKSVLD